MLKSIDDYIEIPHSQSIGLTFRSTISVWLLVEPQTQPTWYTIVEKSDPERGGHSRWGLWLIRDRAEFCVQTASISTHHCLDSAEPLRQNGWHHLVGVTPLETVVTNRPGKTMPLARLPELVGQPVTVSGYRLPGWTGGRGFYLSDGQTFVLARGNESFKSPPSWQPVVIRGRWLTDAFGTAWLQVDRLTKLPAD